ncbi:hypothetical protein Sjap_021488 [Stephania japonica]|uniref:separase n=1 Tax=Stephania japonica TaxID=461633 RepID=A0AAP0EM31_9MAGN
MLEEDACFDGDLVHDFCIMTLTKCLVLSTKDQFLKLVNNLFSLVTSRRVSRPALILNMLKLLLDSISCKCKVGLEYTINDSLDLLHYCVKKCRLSSKAMCNDVARLLERYVQVLSPIDLVLKFYVAGLYSTGGAFWLGIESENSESKSAARILLDDEDDWDCFGSLKCHFRIDQNKCCLPSDYGDKDLGITNTTSDSQLCATCENKHGKASFLSYLNALAFFCQPFAEILNKERKYIVSVKDFQTSPKLNYVHDAFHHFCDLLLVKISFTSEEKEKLYDIQRILLQVVLASFTISIMADENVQASVAFELCCRASWTCVSLLCDKFKDKTVEHHDDWSEETIIGFVTDGCAKSATHLDVLHQCGSSEINAAIVNSLINWSLAANLFENLNAPRLLVKQWVKIICKQFKDTLEDDATPSLYYLLPKSSKELSRQIMGTILEQELLAYEEMESHSSLCQKMQLKIINILLLNIYVSKDYYLQKSLLLIKKGRIFRAQGFERLTDCIRCLSDAISILVILEDVHCALKLWSSIDWAVIIHQDLVKESPIMLLCCICDLLSLKLKDVPLKKCLAVLWSDRRLAHALCMAPVGEDFILDLSEQFDTHSDAVGFWITCMKDSQPLLVGFCQKLLPFEFISSEANHYHLGSSFTSNATIGEVKDVALTLISNVHEPSSAFLAGYLYYDLSERLISAGQLLEALSYSREAFHLRGRLLQKKFVCTFDKFPKNSGGSGEGIGQSESRPTYLEVHASVATQAWPHINGSWKYESCNLSQWNVLECYLESILQGKHISSAEGLPIFRVVFASALGEIYCKKLLWELAESELKSAQKILGDCSIVFSCRHCKLTLEVALDQRVGDLTRRHTFANSKVFSVNSFSHSVDLYKAAMEKLNLPEWEMSLSFSDNPNHLSRRGICSLKVENEVSHGKMETKNCRRSKKSSRLSTREKSQLNQRITCSQLTQDTSSNAQETSTCNRINCRMCLLMKVIELGTMKDVSHIKWENHRRRLLLRLLSGIGKCLWNIDKVHEMHQLFWQSISIILNKKPICGANCSILWNDCPECLELIGKESMGDGFLIERATVLYHIARFSLKNYHLKGSRVVCCDLSGVSAQSILSWLLQAFIFSREFPLLFQKFPAHSGKIQLERHWAMFFHQASLGTYLNHQFLSDASRKLKICSSTYFEGAHLNNSCNTLMEASSFLRLAPEKLDDLEQFVIDFFEGLPSVPIICITLLSSDFANLLWNILPCSPSFSTWMLLSRLGSKGQPIVLLLPVDLIDEDLDGDTLPARESVHEGKESDKRWQCPWSHSIVDDVAPQFKRILEENYLSSSLSSLSVSQESRLLWWTWRRKLNDHLDKFLRDVEDHWFGPWRCLLMGESMNSLCLGSLLSKLTAELKDKCEVDADEEFLKLILGGARSVSEARSCITELVLHKGSIIRGRYCQEKNCQCSDIACDVSSGLSESINQLISDSIIEFEVQCISRQPVVLVLDSDVQMLPWENLPVLRTQEVYRMPSIGCISVVLNMNCHLQNNNEIGSAPFPSIDPLDAFYLLNPSGDLERTQIEFEDWFRDQRLEGKAGAAPTTEELALALKNHDLFIYFGHGNGTQYIHGREIQKLENCAATLLMGCSSGSLSLMGCYNPQGAVLSYLLAGSPAIIANLWEVTDKDIDRFGKAMLTAWLQERSSSTSGAERNNLLIEEFESLDINNKKGNVKKKAQKGRKMKKESKSIPLKNSGNSNRPMIASFMSEARRACTLPFLIGAAPIIDEFCACVSSLPSQDQPPSLAGEGPWTRPHRLLQKQLHQELLREEGFHHDPLH